LKNSRQKNPNDLLLPAFTLDKLLPLTFNLIICFDYCYFFFILVRESVKEMTEKYDEAHRGRELVTFSDYCVYESMVKKHVGNLKQPALDTLKLIRGSWLNF